MQELCLMPKLGMHIINDSTLYSAKYGIQYMVNILTSKKQKFHAIKRIRALEYAHPYNVSKVPTKFHKIMFSCLRGDVLQKKRTD